MGLPAWWQQQQLGAPPATRRPPALLPKAEETNASSPMPDERFAAWNSRSFVTFYQNNKLQRGICGCKFDNALQWQQTKHTPPLPVCCIADDLLLQHFWFQCGPIVVSFEVYSSSSAARRHDDIISAAARPFWGSTPLDDALGPRQRWKVAALLGRTKQ